MRVVFLEKSSIHLSKRSPGWEEVTVHLKGVAAKENPDLFLADATLYLELFGILAIAWQWLKQGIFIVNGVEQLHPRRIKIFKLCG